MRVQRIRLRNFRGLDDSEVSFASQGITIIEGPNEAGKTSIFAGLDLLLSLPDGSKGSEVKSAQQAGSDEGPEVEVELTTGPYRFVYRKRWLSKPETSLRIVAPGTEQLSGREAHDRVNAILAETLDTALWEALRLQQGEKLSLPRPGTRDDDKRTLGDVGSLIDALDVAASGSDAAAEDDALWDRICAKHDYYWTAKGGPRKDLVVSADKLNEARGTVAEIKRQLDQIAEEDAELERLVAGSQRLAAEVTSCETQERELRSEWETSEKIRVEVEQWRAGHRKAEQERERLAGEWRRRQELVAAAESRAAELTELERQAEQSSPGLVDAAQEAEAADKAREDAQAAMSLAEEELSRAERDRDHQRNLIEVEQLSERLQQVAEAELEMQEAETVLAAINVDEELLRGIEQAHLAVERADAAAASAAATVLTTARRPLAVELDGRSVELDDGETHNAAVDQDLVLVVPDTVEVRVVAGTDSQKLAAELATALETLGGLCEQAGVADLAEARQSADKRKDAERAVDLARATIRRELRDLTAKDLRLKVEGLRRRICAYAGERAQQPSPPSGYDEAKQAVDDAKRLLGVRRTALEECEEAVERVAAALHESQIEGSGMAARIDMARTAGQQAEASLEAERSQIADSVIAAGKAEAEDASAAALKSLQAAEEQLNAVDSASLEARLGEARDGLGRARRALQVNRQDQDHLRIELAVRSELGLHTSSEDAQAELQHVERKHQRMEQKAAAARLLHEAFAKRRQEARTRYSRPLKQHIEQLGRVVFGSSFSVEIDERLQIVSRTLDGVTLGVGQLSTGALEQLAVICRLACAAIVSPGGDGAPVVLDDALGWSDPDRLHQMCKTIDEAGQDCQVIILTCTPDRYAAVAGARTVKLPS